MPPKCLGDPGSPEAWPLPGILRQQSDAILVGALFLCGREHGGAPVKAIRHPRLHGLIHSRLRHIMPGRGITRRVDAAEPGTLGRVRND